MTLQINELTASETQYYLQHLVAPRPVCFASTIDKNGNVNLSPFSFFNLFSTNPPVVIFSPSRRVRDNTIKHTLQNVQEVPEVVINVVTYNMVRQVSLASCEYPKSIDEFAKAGFTKQAASYVTPPMVAESRAKLECRVTEIKSLGDQGGAGQLVFAEVICMHVDDDLLTPDKKFSQEKLELVARLGGNWYAKISSSNLFQVEKPNTKCGIGIDSLPEEIRNSNVLTGNHLGQLANVHEIPTEDPAFYDGRLDAFHYYFREEIKKAKIHSYVKELLEEGKTMYAWQVLLAAQHYTPRKNSEFKNQL